MRNSNFFLQNEPQPLDLYQKMKMDLEGLVSRSAAIGSAQTTVYGSDRQGVITVHEALQSLITSMHSDVFRVAIIGEYSTGKSSLINVLLDLVDLKGRKTSGTLPTAIVPTTATVASLYYSEATQIEIVLDSGERLNADEDELSAFLSQPNLWEKFAFRREVQRKQEIARQICEVRIGCHSPLLSKGVEFVDTPGLGSVYKEHLDITRRQVPLVDAVLFVMSVDPPMGEREMSFLQYVCNFTEKFVFVQNKRDIGMDMEHGIPIFMRREREHRKRIEEVLGHQNYKFFHVSALESAKARRNDSSELQKSSGIPSLLHQLEEFLTKESGLPRQQDWLLRLRKALDLININLVNRMESINARLREHEIEYPVTDDYEQLKAAEVIFMKSMNKRLKNVKNELDEVIPKICSNVGIELEQLLQAQSPAVIHSDVSSQQKMERDMLRVIQERIAQGTSDFVEEQIKSAEDGVRQVLGAQMPQAFYSYRNFDDTQDALNNLKIHIPLNKLVKSQVTISQRRPKGAIDQVVSWVLGFFGGDTTERTETFSWNHEYLRSTLNVAILHAVDDLKKVVSSHLKEMRDATVAELKRIDETARQANEENRRICKQSQEKCEFEQKSLEQEQHLMRNICADIEQFELQYALVQKT